MLASPGLYTPGRVDADMADLEVLGGLTFDLEINRDQGIRDAFVRLVGVLGTERFIEGYVLLYRKILDVLDKRAWLDSYREITGGAYLQEVDVSYSAAPEWEDLLDEGAFKEIWVSDKYVEQGRHLSA